MRINSEEAMVKAIRLKQKEDVSWIELIRRSRERDKDKPLPDDATASRVAGA